MRLGFAWLALTTLLAAGCKQQEAAPAPAQSPAESQQTPVSAPMQPGASRPSPMPTVGSESTDTPTSDDLPQKRKAEDLSLPEAEKALDEAATDAHTSLNQYLVFVLARALGQYEAGKSRARRVRGGRR